MGEDRNFYLRIVTPERVFYDGEVDMVEFNTTEGEIGVLPGHVPMTVIVKPGILVITEKDGKKQAALHSGFVEILPEGVTVLAEIIEWPEEIDQERAEAAMSRAKDRLANREAADTDIARAEVALQKAMARIQAIK